MCGRRMIFVETIRNIKSEGNCLKKTDTKRRRFGEQRRLETSVVRTVNDEWKVRAFRLRSINAR